MVNKWIQIILMLIPACLLHAQIDTGGVIKGTVVDKDTRETLPGVNVVILNSLQGAATDENGIYTINTVASGHYTLGFSYIGYNTITKTDVIVRPGRLTVVDVQLNNSGLTTETIQVTSGYFTETQTGQVSTINFSAEEIRRSPGTAGDVSRIVMSLPSIAKVNDQSNSLIVRGGSPLENGFYVDNIAIPNINHFPTQGSSGGPIGILNVDYIRNVDFYSGGFASRFGGHLSSVMDISFREGNREKFEGQLDLNFAGFGGSFEGPLDNENGSWMISLKRSYLDLIIKTVDLGTSIAPVYGDIQSKVVYDIDQQNRLTLLTIMGDDHSRATQEVAIENNMVAFGNQNYLEVTAGLNWRKIWQGKGYSNTSLAFTAQRYDNISKETGTSYLLRTNDSQEQSWKLRNINHLRLTDFMRVDLGFEGKWYSDIYHSYYAAYSDILGNMTDELIIDNTLLSGTGAAFFSIQYDLNSKVKASLGARMEYFDVNSDTKIAPRLALSYKVDGSMTINGSWGIFYQQLPTVLLAQLPEKSKVKTPAAIHSIIGVDKMLYDDTRLLVEVYSKKYSDFPLDPAQQSFFLVDELYYNSFENFLNHPHIKYNGEAQSYGLEVTLQKKMARDFYGLLAASWSKSRYKALDTQWRDRVYDNRLTVSMEGGYKPDNLWEFSLRWIYAAGAPYTPFDEQASMDLNRAVLDENKINGQRYTGYHSLNIRCDRRFHFENSNLVFYLSVWNAYDRKNIATYFWNQQENSKDVIYQWRMLPIFGLEYEF